MENRVYPSHEEKDFLQLGYNRFFDICDQMTEVSFWDKSEQERLLLLKDLISVYVELIKYEPLKLLLKNSKRANFKLVGKDFMSFLRNLLLHFPFFKSWDEIIFDRKLITSIDPAGSIDEFLSKKHPKDLKYRVWDSKSKNMTYIEINLQTNYRKGEKVSLKDIITEREGALFLSGYMYVVLMSQVSARSI